MLKRTLHLLGLWAILAAAPSYALTGEQALAIAAGDSTDARVTALNAAVAGSPDPRTAAFLQAMSDDAVKVAGQQVFVVVDGKGTDPVTGAALAMPDDAEDVVNNNLMRSALAAAQAALQLASPDAALRAQAAKALLTEPDESRLPLIDKALAAETDAGVKAQLELVRATTLLASPDQAKRLAAAQALGQQRSPDIKLLLNERLADEPDADVKAALTAAIAHIDDGLAWGERLGVLFTGVSLGSILLLAALGLAITYGLMGVINMAHGELIMIGAYATYVVQTLFRQYLPGAFDWYLVAALPVAFIASAGVGAVLERSVIRYLYGRPLETLLATWGISLILMQTVRTIFGAQNVEVANPAWMSGGVTVLGGLVLPYNRLAIIGFAVVVVMAVWLILNKTRLGLFVRAVTQNRRMADCVGVATGKVDMLTFGLGSGIAGLGGVALSQLGNVGPDLGQSYIVDSFMVVVLGGVGQLAGTVIAALGLGEVNKFLEPVAGAVLAKIAILVFIIIFIQRRPQGLFAMKGRSVE